MDMTTSTLEGLLTISGYRVVTEHTGGNCTALRITHPAITGYVLATEAYAPTAPWAYAADAEKESDGGLLAMHYHDNGDWDRAEEIGQTENDAMVPSVLLSSLLSIRSDVMA